MLYTDPNKIEPYHFEQEYNEDHERESVSVSDGEFARDQESDQLDRLQSNDWCNLRLLPSKEEDFKC